MQVIRFYVPDWLVLPWIPVLALTSEISGPAEETFPVPLSLCPPTLGLMHTDGYCIPVWHGPPHLCICDLALPGVPTALALVCAGK